MISLRSKISLRSMISMRSIISKKFMISMRSMISMISMILSAFSWFPFVGAYLRSFSGHCLIMNVFFSSSISPVQLTVEVQELSTFNSMHLTQKKSAIWAPNKKPPVNAAFIQNCCLQLFMGNLLLLSGCLPIPLGMEAGFAQAISFEGWGGGWGGQSWVF